MFISLKSMKLRSGVLRYAVVYLILAALSGSVNGAVPEGGGGGFIPALNFAGNRLREGDMVKYLFISESYGIRDSSMVTFSIFRSQGREIGVEIESLPLPEDSADAVTVRAVFSADSTAAGCQEGGIDLISVMVRSGAEPFRALNEEEKSEVDINDYFFSPSAFDRKALGSDTIRTPAGTFYCEKMLFTSSSRDEIELGGNRAVRFEETEAVLRRTDEVPLWGIVTSEVRRKRRMEIDYPSIPDRMLNSGEKLYRAVLISFVGSKRK
jgi:hypothetical protein